jgi:hypothetical protein
MIPEAYFCIAKILNQNLDKKEQSKKIMAWLVKKFPDHENSPDMKNYLCAMSWCPSINLYWAQILR